MSACVCVCAFVCEFIGIFIRGYVRECDCSCVYVSVCSAREKSMCDYG